jgi:hypothetical protein
LKRNLKGRWQGTATLLFLYGTSIAVDKGKSLCHEHTNHSIADPDLRSGHLLGAIPFLQICHANRSESIGDYYLHSGRNSHHHGANGPQSTVLEVGRLLFQIKESLITYGIDQWRRWRVYGLRVANCRIHVLSQVF